MKNLLRILVLLIIVVAVVGASMFLVDQNKNYDQNDSVPPISQSGEATNTEIFEPESGEIDVIESGEILEVSGDISGDLNEEIIESGEISEIKEDENLESGEIFEPAEILESGEIASGELAA